MIPEFTMFGYRSVAIRFVVLLMALVTLATPSTYGSVECSRDFAPAEGWIKSPEKPYRAEICLNGLWQFAPVALPKDYQPNTGIPPLLSSPTASSWASEPIKVPSPWNVNNWGSGRIAGSGDQLCWPGSNFYPSYPQIWNTAELGWLRRCFQVPNDWNNKRVVLHFEAVAGECQVVVNGQPAGSHFDKYLSFDLDITGLVHAGETNELLVGVRAHSFFNKQSSRYPKMRAPYPTGSETEKLVGIWQDVFLLGLPQTRVQDVFVKPQVDQDALELEVTLQNDTDKEQTVSLEGNVQPWVNLAPGDVLSAPEPRWKLDAPVMSLHPEQITIQPHGQKTLQLREPVNNRLKLWTPDSPNLYASVIVVKQNGQVVDQKLTRFGWRQFKIDGSNLLLNGQKIQLFGDLLHPFSPLTMSRRYVWTWYRSIKDFGGNAVRPHAQIHPRHYLELADEMGIIVLDETAIFGSSVALNFEEPVAWQRFADHYDGLVLRDRNHPSVVGWSFGNELFAVFNLNQVSKEDTDRWYKELADLGLRARKLDPTRPWISCDGDEDLRGALPVWSRHFGHGTPLDQLPNINKPMMVGESGGSYYARPGQLEMFNGPHAYESYEGRNDALAIDLYDNIVRMARPRLAYFSASETAWFGLEHLPLGYRDFKRMPNERDGIFFNQPFVEGKPGMQIEHIPPYVSTLNPGWDPQLPLYKPLPMFLAQRAALAKDHPQACAWDHRVTSQQKTNAAVTPAFDELGFVGDREAALARQLTRLGVTLADTNSTQTNFVIIDGETITRDAKQQIRDAIKRIQGGGIAMIFPSTNKAGSETLASILSAPFQLSDRKATALVSDPRHPWTSSFSAPDLHFAEDGGERFIIQHGLQGPLIQKSRVLLQASQTDWSLFNNAPEHSKCAAVVLNEHLVKPSGAALVEFPHGAGKIVLCTLNYRIASKGADALWRGLFANMGVKLSEQHAGRIPAFDDQGVLLKALAIGRFAGTNIDTSLVAANPRQGTRYGTLAWTPVTSPSRDRFIFQDLQQEGPQQGISVYFSYWIKSPRSLDDLLADGPDAPHFNIFCYASEKCRLFLNGQELTPAHTEPADYRTRYEFTEVPLKKGWNHFVIQVTANQLKSAAPPTLAVRISSNNSEYFRQLDSDIEVDLQKGSN